MRGDAFTPVPNRGMITISIMLANIMQGLDNTILNVALPHIQGSLSAFLDQIAWTLTSYIVCSAIMMPLTGWLAGRFGIKPIGIVRKTACWIGGLDVSCGHDSDLLSPASFSADRHPARGMAVPSLHAKLSRCRRAAC
jgi:DHA2 family multidrug resistance protein